MTAGALPPDAARLLGAQPAALLTSSFAPGDGFPHTHVHDLHTEVFVIGAGRLEIELDHHRGVFGPGEAAVVAPGHRHSFVAVGEQPAEVVIVVSPPDILEMILELGGLHDNRDAMADVLARYSSRLT